MQLLQGQSCRAYPMAITSCLQIRPLLFLEPQIPSSGDSSVAVLNWRLPLVATDTVENKQLLIKLQRGSQTLSWREITPGARPVTCDLGPGGDRRSYQAAGPAGGKSHQEAADGLQAGRRWGPRVAFPAGLRSPHWVGADNLPVFALISPRALLQT